MADTRTTTTRKAAAGTGAPVPRQRRTRPEPDRVIDLDAHVQPDDGTAFDLDRPIRLRTPLSGTYSWNSLNVGPIISPVLSPGRVEEPAGSDDGEPTGFTPVPDGPLPRQLPGWLPGDRLPARPIDLLPTRFDPVRLRLRAETLRVDVDGYSPQHVVSGTITAGLARRLDWIAHVVRTPHGTYAGPISYRDGDSGLLPQTRVEVRVRRRSYFQAGAATATFTGGGAADLVREYAFSSSAFHPVQFEYDVTSDSTAVTTFDTASHANRPADLPLETISVEQVFRRAGLDVSLSSGGGVVPVSAAGSDAKWTDQELNDAMAVYWSAYSTSPRWAAWALFAGQSIRGSSLGGIMFDYSGTGAQRQGAAIFSNSFISNPPAGDPHSAAFVQRMRFWTAVHELGHTFNLAHAWDKPAGVPWIPTSDESGLFSFMNYPYRYSPGGTAAFFSSFRYRFSDSELLFMRHAPARFVEQGDALWFDKHGFEQAVQAAGSALVLALRAHRPAPTYDFLEPVTLELKLTNTGQEPMLVDDSVLAEENLTIVIARRGRTARCKVPYAFVCRHPRQTVLEPGQSVYGSITVSSGREGWDVAEPGDYSIAVALHLSDQDVVASPLLIRVRPPHSREDEVVAQDFFTPEVGRVLAAGGTRRSSKEADVLQEVAERLKGRPVARHVRYAIGRPLQRPAKQLVVDDGTAGSPVARKFDTAPARPDQAAAELAAAVSDIAAAADTFGHIAVRKRVQAYAAALVESGKKAQAVRTTERLRAVLAERGVKDSVLAEISADAAALAGRKR